MATHPEQPHRSFNGYENGRTAVPLEDGATAFVVIDPRTMRISVGSSIIVKYPKQPGHYFDYRPDGLLSGREDSTVALQSERSLWQWVVTSTTRGYKREYDRILGLANAGLNKMPVRVDEVLNPEL